MRRRAAREGRMPRGKAVPFLKELCDITLWCVCVCVCVCVRVCVRVSEREREL